MRWPYLQIFPNFTDEIAEVRYAVGIAAGDSFPLTAKDTYFGPIHAYILAALLKLFGPSVALPRLAIMVFGALTVVAAYLLGRELAGRAVGAVAAALLATSPQHVLINSHIAWQHSTMPFYGTLCCWAFVRALRALPSSARHPDGGKRERRLAAPPSRPHPVSPPAPRRPLRAISSWRGSCSASPSRPIPARSSSSRRWR